MTIGCGRPAADANPPATNPTAPAIATVTVVKPERKTLRRFIEQPGRIEPYEQTPLFVKIAGYVEKVNVDIGDHVQKGQVLAELSVPEMHEELKQKDALIAQAEAEVKQSEAAVEAAKANLKTAEAMVEEAKAGRKRALANHNRWQSEYKRVQDLVARKVLDQQVHDETLNQFEAAQAAREEVEAKVLSAEAARDESKAKRDKAEADVGAAKARRQVAQADRDRMAALVDYAKVRAPYNGIVVRRHIDTGHFLQPATSGKGEPLFVVINLEPLRIYVDVPEADAVGVADGAAARVRVQALGGQEFDGVVKRSSWSLDPHTRTLRTEIQLTPHEGKLRPGMYAYARITIETPNVLTLPASALVTQNEQTFCFLVENGKAARTPVKIGMKDGQSVEVLKKQVKPSEAGKEAAWVDFTRAEEVVERDAKALTDGQAVSVMNK